MLCLAPRCLPHLCEPFMLRFHKPTNQAKLSGRKSSIWPHTPFTHEVAKPTQELSSCSWTGRKWIQKEAESLYEFHNLNQASTGWDQHLSQHGGQKHLALRCWEVSQFKTFSNRAGGRGSSTHTLHMNKRNPMKLSCNLSLPQWSSIMLICLVINSCKKFKLTVWASIYKKNHIQNISKKWPPVGYK